jgi:hypothetical protein
VIALKQLVLPYLTSSITSTGRTGKLKFGWREAQVDIPEVLPSDFRIAFGRIINADNSFIRYEFEGRFWSSAIAPVRPMAFNSGGVHWEAPYSDSERGWLELTAAEAFERRLRERGRTEGLAVRKNNFSDLKIRSRLASGDGHESDRSDFLSLGLGEPRMGRRTPAEAVHSPSITIGWGSSQFSITSTCNPLRGSSCICGYGKHDFDPGLHFRPGDPDFEAAWAEAEELLKTPVRQREFAHNRHYAHAMREALARAGFADRMTIHDNTVFDPLVLADVSHEGWEDMGERSSVRVAESIVATSAPNFHRAGPKRDALDGLKRLVDIVPQERPEDFKDLLDAALASLPTEGEPARAWFVDKALAQWSDRKIAFSPAPLLAFGGR